MQSLSKRKEVEDSRSSRCHLPKQARALSLGGLRASGGLGGGAGAAVGLLLWRDLAVLGRCWAGGGRAGGGCTSTASRHDYWSCRRSLEIRRRCDNEQGIGENFG